MKATSLVAFLHHIKIAKEFGEDFNRALSKPILRNYITRLDYILNDFQASIHFPDDVRQAIREELQSDVMIVEAISDRIRLLNPAQREVVEMLIDMIIKGEEVMFVGPEK